MNERHETTNYTKGNEMKCCICKKDIEMKYTPDGELYWDKGNNPYPVTDALESRCCDSCNQSVVVPLRLSLLTNKDVQDAPAND